MDESEKSGEGSVERSESNSNESGDRSNSSDSEEDKINKDISDKSNSNHSDKNLKNSKASEENKSSSHSHQVQMHSDSSKKSEKKEESNNSSKRTQIIKEGYRGGIEVSREDNGTVNLDKLEEQEIDQDLIENSKKIVKNNIKLGNKFNLAIAKFQILMIKLHEIDPLCNPYKMSEDDIKILKEYKIKYAAVIPPMK